MSLLWANDSGSGYNQSSGGAPQYLSRDDALRWERLRQAKLLYRGDHRKYFLDEGRSQHDYPEEEINGRLVRRYVTLNLCGLVSNTTADLLFGAAVKIDLPEGVASDALNALMARSVLQSRLHTAAVQASWAGGAFLECVLWRGEPYIEVIPPDEIFPRGPLMPDGQYQSYVRYATANIGTIARPNVLLLTTTYTAGSILRQLNRISVLGTIEQDSLPLGQWPTFAADPKNVPPPESKTGLDLNTIVYLPNVVGESTGVCDYDGKIELQDNVSAKYTQVARVLHQHADPAVGFPTRMAGPDGNVRTRRKAFFFDNPDELPKYITWEAQLDTAMKDRTEAVLAFCTAAEMSPVLLGIRQGATPDAARKLRLEATKDLAKTARKALLINPAIARAVFVSLELQKANTPTSFENLLPGVHVRDGLPVDGLDQATEASTWTGAGLMSVEDGVAMRIDDPIAAAAEVDRIKKEKAAAIPTVLSPFGGETPQDQAANEAAAETEAA